MTNKLISAGTYFLVAFGIVAVFVLVNIGPDRAGAENDARIRDLKIRHGFAMESYSRAVDAKDLDTAEVKRLEEIELWNELEYRERWREHARSR